MKTGCNKPLFVQWIGMSVIRCDLKHLCAACIKKKESSNRAAVHGIKK